MIHEVSLLSAEWAHNLKSWLYIDCVVLSRLTLMLTYQVLSDISPPYTLSLFPKTVLTMLSLVFGQFKTRFQLAIIYHCDHLNCFANARPHFHLLPAYLVDSNILQISPMWSSWYLLRTDSISSRVTVILSLLGFRFDISLHFFHTLICVFCTHASNSSSHL